MADVTPHADRAEEAARLLQRLDQHGGLVTLSADAASVIRALLTECQSLMERVRLLEGELIPEIIAKDEARALTVSLRAELEEERRQKAEMMAGWTRSVERLEREKAELAVCPDHGPHVGFRYCPECYQRAFTAGQEAALAASSPKEPSR